MDDVNADANGGFRRVEVLTGPGRRRRWSASEKGRIVAETLAPGTSVSEVARRWQVCPQQVFAWRREARAGFLALPAEATDRAFARSAAFSSGWRISRRRSPRVMPGPRSVTRRGTVMVLPSGGRVGARCRRTCRGSRSSWSPRIPVHRQRHPFAMVPVFEADGRQLIESGAIVYAIAKKSAALMPEDEPGRDQTLAWMFAALNTVDVPVQDLFDVDVLHSKETWAQLRRPDVVRAVEVRLGELADALGEGDYLLGRFTAADI